MEFHNSCIEFNKIFYDSHADLIRNVCYELGQEDKIDEVTNKLLSKTFIKMKPMKDPNRPKRPKSSYMFFTAEIREKLVKKNPNASMTELSKIMGAEWAKVSEKDRVKYTRMAEEDKARYDEALEEYEKNKQ